MYEAYPAASWADPSANLLPSNVLMNLWDDLTSPSGVFTFGSGVAALRFPDAVSLSCFLRLQVRVCVFTGPCMYDNACSHVIYGLNATHLSTQSLNVTHLFGAKFMFWLHAHVASCDVMGMGMGAAACGAYLTVQTFLGPCVCTFAWQSVPPHSA